MKKNSNRFVALVMALVMLVLTPMSALAEAADTGISTPTDTTAVVQQPASGDPEPSTEPELSQEPAPTQEPAQSPDPVPSQEPETSQEPDPTPATSPNMSNPAKQTDGRSVSNQPVVLGASLGDPAPASGEAPGYAITDGSFTMKVGETKTVYAKQELRYNFSNDYAVEVTGGTEVDTGVYQFTVKAKYPTNVEWYGTAIKLTITCDKSPIVNNTYNFSTISLPDNVKNLFVGDTSTFYSVVQLTVPEDVKKYADVDETVEDGVWKYVITAKAVGQEWNWGLNIKNPSYDVKYGENDSSKYEKGSTVKHAKDANVAVADGNGKYFSYWTDGNGARVNVGDTITGPLTLTPVYEYPTVNVTIHHKYAFGGNPNQPNYYDAAEDSVVTVQPSAETRTIDLSAYFVDKTNVLSHSTEKKAQVVDKVKNDNTTTSLDAFTLDTTTLMVNDSNVASVEVTLYYDAYVTIEYAVDIPTEESRALPGIKREFVHGNKLLAGDENLTIVEPKRVRMEDFGYNNFNGAKAYTKIGTDGSKVGSDNNYYSSDPKAQEYKPLDENNRKALSNYADLKPGSTIYLTYDLQQSQNYGWFDITFSYYKEYNDQDEYDKVQAGKQTNSPSWQLLRDVKDGHYLNLYYGEKVTITFPSIEWNEIAVKDSKASSYYQAKGTTFELWKYHYNATAQEWTLGENIELPDHKDASENFTYICNAKETKHYINLAYRVKATGEVDPTITVTYKVEGEGGSVTPTSNTGVSATTPVTGTEAGQVSGSTATANPGYDFVGWYKEISDGVLAENAITTNANLTDALAKDNLNKDASNNNLYADTTYVAKFTPKTIKVEYKVEGEGGSVNHASDTASKITGNVVNGSTATPADGYEFDGWYKGDTLITTEKTLSAGDSHTNLNKDANNDKLYADTTYVAKFTPKTINVEYKVEGEGGSVNHASDTASKITGNVVNGSTATPADGYEFDGWYKGDTLITTEKTLSAGDSHTNLNKDATNDNLYADTTYVAKFKVKVTPPPKPTDDPTPSPTPEQTPEAPTPSPTPEQTPEAPTPQPVRPRPTVTPVPEEEQPDPTEEPTPEPVKYRVTVNYWFEKVGGVPAGLPFSNVYATGEAYKVVSRKIPGWDVDKAEVSGVMAQEDVVVDVVYTMQEHTLTIHYIYADGTEAAPTVTKTLKPGDSYNVASPEIDGTVASRKTVAGLMPAWDMTATVIYIKPILPNPDRTRTGTNLFIIEDYETPLGIGNVNLNAGECFE